MRLKSGDGVWYFSLTSMGATSILAWLAVETVFGGGSYFQFKKDISAADLKWLPILELADYEALHIEWACRLGCRG